MKLQHVLRHWAAPALAASALIAIATACQAPVPADISLTGGNPAGSKVIVDLLSFQPISSHQRDIKVQPGPHYIRIEKNGAVIFDRTVTLAQGQIFQVAIP